MDRQTRDRLEARAAVFKALAHPTRLFIVEQLTRGRRCVCELNEMIEADQSTVSKHLSVLKNAGVVRDEKVGMMVFYELLTPAVKELLSGMETVLRTSAERGLELAGQD